MAEDGTGNLQGTRNISSIKTIILMGQTGAGTVGWTERLIRNQLSGVFIIGRVIKICGLRILIARPYLETKN